MQLKLIAFYLIISNEIDKKSSIITSHLIPA